MVERAQKTTWDQIVNDSGITREEIQKAETSSLIQRRPSLVGPWD